MPFRNRTAEKKLAAFSSFRFSRPKTAASEQETDPTRRRARAGAEAASHARRFQRLARGFRHG